MEESTDSFVFKTTDKFVALQYLKASDMAIALHDISQYLRAKRKYHEPNDELDYATLEKVEEEINQIIQSNGLLEVII